MKISGDMAVKLVLGAVVLGGIGYVAWKISRGASALVDLVPQVVKDGFDASGQLLQLGTNMVAHPLDTFGIVPADANGRATWERTTPWANPVPFGSSGPAAASSDPVSNNSDGINYNNF